MEKSLAPINVFYSCSDSPTDAPLLEQLECHLSTLQREGLIATWHKRQIVAGSARQEEVDRHLNVAALILLLVSSDFLASDYCYGTEMQRALQRHETNEAIVVPLLLRPCDWQSTPFASLQALPSGEKPITLWSNRDAGWTNVVKGIKTALESIQHLSPLSAFSGAWNVPYHRNPYFTGRDELFDQLDQYLAPPGQKAALKSRRVALTQPRALTGLGGIGKTQIAVEYAYRACEHDLYTHTFWVNASTETLLIDFAALADLLPGFSMKGETDQRKRAEAVKCWLEQCQERWFSPALSVPACFDSNSVLLIHFHQ
jgi:TIR domain